MLNILGVFADWMGSGRRKLHPFFPQTDSLDGIEWGKSHLFHYGGCTLGGTVKAQGTLPYSVHSMRIGVNSVLKILAT